MSKGNKNQHYVPQFYIKNFGEEDKIFVFDIGKKVSFKTNVRNIGAQNYYHNIDTEIIKGFFDSSDEDFVDSEITKLFEGFYSGYFDYFEKIVDISHNTSHGELIMIDTDKLNKLIDYMIIQYIRSKRFRKSVEPFGVLTYEMLSKYKFPYEFTEEKLIQITHMIFLYRTLSEVVYGEVRNMKKGYDSFSKFTTSFINIFRDNFNAFGCTMLVNESSKSFFTSDSPVVINWTDESYVSFDIVYFPLNKNVSFLFFDKNKMPDANEFDKCALTITEKKIDILDNLNLFVSNYAYRFVFNEKCDFEMLKEFIDGKFKLKLKLY